MTTDYISVRPEEYWRGRDDYARHSDKMVNPYPYGTPGHYAYAAGWLGAEVGEAAVIDRPEGE